MATTAIERKQQQRVTLRNLFEQQRPELSKLLPRGMDADRLFRMALTECVKNPALLDCTAESWALAIQTCAAQGLYPDSGLGYMYLIPRNNKKKRGNEWITLAEVTAMRGYQGDIALARKSGEILDIYAEVVHERDTYHVRKGLDRTIEHEPYMGDEEPGKLVGCYAVAKLRGGEVAWVTLTRRDIDRHKKSAQGLSRDDSPWNAHEEAMWRKTAIRELFKWLPKASDESERIAREIMTAEAERNAREPIDVAALEVPVETRPGLAGVTDQLRAEQGDEGAGAEPAREPGSDDGDETPTAAADAPRVKPADCEHPSVPPSRVAQTPKGKSVVCEDCGEAIPGEAEPPKSGAKKTGQRRLEE